MPRNSAIGERARLSEAKRVQVLLEDPDVEKLEDYRAFCGRCKIWLSLPTYAIYTWHQHTRSDKHARCFPSKRNLKTISGQHARAEELRADPDTSQVCEDRVYCLPCDRWISLDGRGKYELQRWRYHKVGRDHCAAAKEYIHEQSEDNLDRSDTPGSVQVITPERPQLKSPNDNDFLPRTLSRRSSTPSTSVGGTPVAKHITKCDKAQDRVMISIMDTPFEPGKAPNTSDLAPGNIEETAQGVTSAPSRSILSRSEAPETSILSIIDFIKTELSTTAEYTHEEMMVTARVMKDLASAGALSMDVV